MQLNLGVQQESITVGATSTILMSEQPGRSIFFIRNLSTGGQVITLGFGKAAVAGNGIVLVPGDYCQESNKEGFAAWDGTITAISSAAGGIVSVYSR
jgi:hypothetical protein